MLQSLKDSKNTEHPKRIENKLWVQTLFRTNISNCMALVKSMLKGVAHQRQLNFCFHLANKLHFIQIKHQLNQSFHMIFHSNNYHRSIHINFI